MNSQGAMPSGRYHSRGSIAGTSPRSWSKSLAPPQTPNSAMQPTASRRMKRLKDKLWRMKWKQSSPSLAAAHLDLVRWWIARMTQICVPLLDEGTDVWRPILASTSQEMFIASQARFPKTNSGSFLPGQLVRRHQKLSGGDSYGIW